MLAVEACERESSSFRKRWFETFVDQIDILDFIHDPLANHIGGDIRIVKVSRAIPCQARKHKRA